MGNEHRQLSRSGSASSRRSQRQPSQQQDVITQIAPPGTAPPQLSKLHGAEEVPTQFPPDTLNNKYGDFQIQRGVEVGRRPPFGRSYSTEIEMTPNRHTRRSDSLGVKASKIDFVQVVRSGTDDNWKTTAADHGYQTNESGQPIDYAHRAELTEQETGTGWRVDQTNYDTPFHGESHSGDVGRHHFTKQAESARLKDGPEIVEPGYKFEAMSTAMDKKTGKEFGTVEWGFNVDRNDRGESILRDRPPTFLEDNLKSEDESVRNEARERDRGRLAAYEQWNRAASGKEEANRKEAERRQREGISKERPIPVTRIPRRGSTSTN